MTRLLAILTTLALVLAACGSTPGTGTTTGGASSAPSAAAKPTYGGTLTFGAILGFLAAIFGGWLGGLLAPSHVVGAVAPARAIPAGAPTTLARATERREVVTERPRRILPAFGQKGGDRVEKETVRTIREDRIQDRS